jgi:hypothetical protein
VGVYDIPKRRNRIRWHMDGVSLFTAVYDGSDSLSSSSSSSSHMDIIQWRKLFHASDHGMSSSQYDGADDDDDETSPQDHGAKDMLKMAIEDFEIKAHYKFTTAIFRQDASKMPVDYRDPAEIDTSAVCSFRLFIPFFNIDLDSSQFYVILNVIRNSLLAPPPPLARTLIERGKKSIIEASKNKRVIELSRDEQIKRMSGTGEIASHSIFRHVIYLLFFLLQFMPNEIARMPKLDKENRYCREEIRQTIEQSINAGKLLLEHEKGNARFYFPFVSDHF